jgi:predicted phosphodiesterase
VVKALLIGDPHVVPQELDDCLALKQLVLDTLKKNDLDTVIITGDCYHSHSVLSTVCVDYWNGFFDEVGQNVSSIVAVLGNHDFFSPSIMNPHALICHKKGHKKLTIVDKPTELFPGVAALPYYYDPVKFMEACSDLTGKTLICHQTFDGARYTDGFYAKDAINPVAVPFDNIISGHVHTPHAFGKVWYAGSPRWRTLSDANQDRFLYVVEFDGAGNYRIVESISTSPACKKIVKFVDQEGSEPTVITVPQNADVRIDIFGSSDYISKKTLAYKAAYKAKCRSFPTRVKQSKVSESDGIAVSFGKFSKGFNPPKGTDLNLLMDAANERLSVLGV